MSQKERQLLMAVEKGQTKLIETLISQGVRVNCKARDDGSTPLIKAAKCRNHVVQKLLLQQGADISAKNVLGLTALHYTAEAGDTETLKLLLAYKSPLDVPDVEGCTPLHYAAYRKNLATTEILLFCGANVDFKNKKRLSPFATNRNKDFRELARQSRRVREAIEHKDIIIEHDELHPGKTSHLKNIGLKIFTPDNFKLHSLSFLCRRIRPELCEDLLKPVGKEILISDAFEYITSTVHIKGEVELEVPLYDHPNAYELIQIKSNLGNIEDPSTIVEGPIKYNKHLGVLRWKLRIRLDITKIKSFILITIPKVERFEVTPRGGEFVSEVDKFINIKVAPDTFQTGTVNVEVIPTPVYKSEKFKNIVSIGNFYELHHGLGCNKFQKNGVTFTLPLPHEFKSEGELCVLAAEIPMDFDPDLDILDENIWEILDRDPKTIKRRVSFDLSHFSTHVLAEKRMGTTDASLKTKVNEIYVKACKRAKLVCFFAVLKLKAEFIYEIVFECTIPQKVTDRLNQWKSNNFIALSPECTGDFDSHDRQEYIIKLSGNIKKEFGTTKLQFHSKRTRKNFQRFVISFANQQKPAFGSLDVIEMPKEQELTSIMVWLLEMSVKNTTLKNEDSFKGFTQEKLLKKIASKLGPEWTRFCLLLGIPFRKVDEIRTETSKDNSTENKIMKVLLEWRKNSQHLDDMGVVDLVTALSRVERNDIADLVHQDLKEWLKENKFEKEDKFYKWAEKAIKGTLDISRKEDCLEPMSDEFFVLLVEKFANPEFQNLGVLLGISEKQNSNIFADTDFPNYQYKVLHMFIVARERQNDRLNALTKLTEALQITENIDCLQWVHDCMKKWSQNIKDDQKKTKFQVILEEKSIRRENEESDLGEEAGLIVDNRVGNKKIEGEHELESQHKPDKKDTATKELDKFNDEERKQNENIGENREIYEYSASDLKAVTFKESVVVEDNDVKLSKVTIIKEVEDADVKLQENKHEGLEKNKSELKKDEKEEHPKYKEKYDYKLGKNKKEQQKEEISRNYESNFKETKNTSTNRKDSQSKNYEHKDFEMRDEQIDKSKCSNPDLEKLENSKESKNKVEKKEAKKDDKEDTSTKKLCDSKNEECREDANIHENHEVFEDSSSDHKDIAFDESVVIKDNNVKLSEANIIKKVEEADVKLPENKKEELEERSELKEEEKEERPEYSENNEYEPIKDKKEEQYKHSRNYESRFKEDEKPEKNSEDSDRRNQDHEEVKMIDVQLDQSKCSNSDFAKIENSKECENKIKKIEEAKHESGSQDNVHKEDTSTKLLYDSKNEESKEDENKSENQVVSDHKDVAMKESVVVEGNDVKLSEAAIMKKVEEADVKLPEDQQENFKERSELTEDERPEYSENNYYEQRKDKKKENQEESSGNSESRLKKDEKSEKNCEDSESRNRNQKEVKKIDVQLDQSECSNSDFAEIENSKEKENKITKIKANDLELQDKLVKKYTFTKVLYNSKDEESKEDENKIENHEVYEDSASDHKDVALNKSVVIENYDVKFSEAATCIMKDDEKAKENIPNDQQEKLSERSELKEDEKEERTEYSENYDYELTKNMKEDKQEEHSRNFESRLKEDEKPEKSHKVSKSKYDDHKEVEMRDKQIDQSEYSISDLEKLGNSKEKENKIKKIEEKHDIESQHKLDKKNISTKKLYEVSKEDENLNEKEEVYGNSSSDQKDDATNESVVIKDNNDILSEANTCIIKEVEEAEIKLPEYQQENLKENEPEQREDDKQRHLDDSENNNYELTKDKKEEQQEEHSRNYESTSRKAKKTEKSREDSESKNQENKEVKMIDKQLDQTQCSNSDLEKHENSEESENKVEEDKSTRIHQDELNDDDTGASTSNTTNSDNNEKYSEAYTLVNQQHKLLRYYSEKNEKPPGGNACIVSDTDVIEGKCSDSSHQTFKDNGTDLDEDEGLDKIQENTDESDSHIGVSNSEEQQDRSIEGLLEIKELVHYDYESKNESHYKKIDI